MYLTEAQSFQLVGSIAPRPRLGATVSPVEPSADRRSRLSANH